MGLSSDWLEHLVRKPALSFCIGNRSSRVSTGPSAEKSIDSLEASPLVQSVKQTSWRLCSSTTDSIDRLETSLQSYRIYRQAGDIPPVLQNLLTAWRHRSSIQNRKTAWRLQLQLAIFIQTAWRHRSSSTSTTVLNLQTSWRHGSSLTESVDSQEAPALVSHL